MCRWEVSWGEGQITQQIHNRRWVAKPPLFTLDPLGVRVSRWVQAARVIPGDLVRALARLGLHSHLVRGGACRSPPQWALLFLENASTEDLRPRWVVLSSPGCNGSSKQSEEKTARLHEAASVEGLTAWSGAAGPIPARLAWRSHANVSAGIRSYRFGRTPVFLWSLGS